MSSSFSFKSVFLILALLTIPIFGWIFFGINDANDTENLHEAVPGERVTLEAGKDYRIDKEGVSVSDLPDSDMLETFASLKAGFKDIAISLVGDTALAQETVRKETSVKDENHIVESTYELDGVTIRTEYKKKKDDSNERSLDEGREKVKQTIYIANRTDQEKIVTFTTTTRIGADTVVWNGQEYRITHKSQIFKAEEKTASIPEFAKDLGQKDIAGVDAFKGYTHTYLVGTSLSFKTEDGKEATFDWSDAAHLDCRVRVYERKGEFFFEFTVSNFKVSANGESVIDPNYALSDTASYDARLDGSSDVDQTNAVTEHIGALILIGDVNGDGNDDLILPAPYAANNGAYSGSVYVVFGGTGLTGSGSDRLLETATNYNIRYDGAAAYDYLSYNHTIGDVNGDGLGDLILTTWRADNNGIASGSAWVIFSTLIDDVGATTGNNKPLSTGTNYNIRYDGAAAYDYLTWDGAYAISDVNGDGFSDLVIGTSDADNNGIASGSAWVIFSTLIDDVGATTGNVKSLATGTNYNIRYDGAAAYDYLSFGNSVFAGDVNGDGLGDLILGAWAASNNGSSSGSAYVIFSTLIDDVGATTGNNKPLSTGTNYNISYDGAAVGDNLTGNGYDAEANLALGDVNGDGFDDLVVGAPQASNNGSTSGSVWVMFSTLIDDVGTSTGNNKPLSTGTNYNIRYDGIEAYDYLSASGSIFIGDVNGDGLGDLVLGDSWNYDYVWVIFSTLIDDVGATTGNVKSLATGTNYNIRYDGARANLIKLGDVNGDGFGDLVLSLELADNNGTDSGSVWIIFSTLIDDVGATTGNTKLLSTSTNYNIRYDGAAAGDYLGYGDCLTCIPIGDLNDDSYDDLILGALYADNNDSDSGSAYVVFSTLIDDVGATTGNTKLLSTSTNYNIRYDGALLIAGVSGADGFPAMGSGGVAIGDVNGDSVNDLVVGSSTAKLSDDGGVFVVFGGTSFPTGTSAPNVDANYNIRYDGAAIYDRLTNGGLSIADMNNDGKGDLILGSKSTDYNSTFGSGSVWVIFSTLIDDVGATTGNVKSLATGTNYNLRYDGDASYFDYNSLTIAAIGDVNGDSTNDLVLGARAAGNNGTESGSYWVILSSLISGYGSTTGNNIWLATATNYNIRYDGASASTYFESLALGDVDGDGKKDMIIGTSLADYNSLANSGSVWVIFSTLIDDVGTSTGNNKPLSTSTNYNIRYDGTAANVYFNGPSLGDVNGDGLGDLLLYADEAPHGGATAGATWVIFSTLIDDVGATTGNNKLLSTATNYNIRYDGGAGYFLNEYHGIVLGDVNGDNLGDLLLTSYRADFGATDAGVIYAVFSTLIDDVGVTTGNVRSVMNSSYYNVRVQGAVANDYLSYNSASFIADANGDGKTDLIVGSERADNNGTDSGSVWILYSSLLSTAGTSTGNDWSLSSAANYNIRYDGASAGDGLDSSLIRTGGLNGDTDTDLIFFSQNSDYNGTNTGSVWVVFQQFSSFMMQGLMKMQGAIKFSH